MYVLRKTYSEDTVHTDFSLNPDRGRSYEAWQFIKTPIERKRYAID